MKRKLVAVCILTLFSAEMFGQAIITKAAEISLNQNSAIASSTPSPTGTPVSTGTVASNNNQDNLKDVGSYKNENFEYNVKKDDTHKYIELSYYIGSNHSIIIPDKIDGIPVEVLKSGLFAFNKTDVYDVTIPESVKLIEYRAFDGTIDKDKNIYYGSSALRNVKILGKDTKIQDDAFYKCSRLIDVEADKNVFNHTNCLMFCDNISNGYLQYSYRNVFEQNNTNNYLFILGDKLILDKLKNNRTDTADFNEITYTFEASGMVAHIKERILPEGIKIIGTGACEYSEYKYIYIPNSVEKIEKNAFKNADIKSIYIPNKNVVIDEGAFDPSVKIYVGDNKPSDFNSLLYSYTDNGELTGYYGSDKVVEIPASINGTAITSICGKIDEGDTIRGKVMDDQSVFNCMNDVEKIVIPEGVTEINDYSFYYCDSLKEVVIPSTVKKISDRAFYGCKNLIKITTCNTNINTNCKGYQDALNNNGAEKKNEKYKIYNGFMYSDSDTGVIVIEGYCGEDKKLIIPDKIDGKIVNSVSGINGNNNIEEVVIPKSVKYVSDFCNCNSLVNVTVDEDTYISYNSFTNTPYIKNICKNNNGLYIRSGDLLYIQENIECLMVPDSVKRIDLYRLINYSHIFSKNFKEVDLSSKTEAYLRKDNKDVKCKSLDDYREFAKEVQKENDYYFTLKLDGKTIWSNEEGVGTDITEKVRPERTEITKPNTNTADSKNIMATFLCLPVSAIAVFKLKKKANL